MTTANSILSKILPGSNPFIFLIIAIVGGFFLKRWLLAQAQLEKILWAIAAVAIYALLLFINKFITI